MKYMTLLIVAMLPSCIIKTHPDGSQSAELDPKVVDRILKIERQEPPQAPEVSEVEPILVNASK